MKVLTMALNRAIISSRHFRFSTIVRIRSSARRPQNRLQVGPPLSDFSGYGGQETKKPSNSGKLFWAMADFSDS